MMDDETREPEIPLMPPVVTPPRVPPLFRDEPPVRPPAMKPEAVARRKRMPPSDIGAVFVVLAAMMVLFPMLSRGKPDHCPLDASRWNTVYYLIEHGTYEYKPDWKLPWNGGKGKRLEEIDPKLQDNAIKVGELYYTVADGRFWGIAPFWTIDMVKIGDKYYSSKQPIMATVVAGVVWVLYRVTPWTFTSASPVPLMRATVIIVQVVPFLAMLWLLMLHIRRQSESPYVRNFCIAAAALGTYLTPYLIPLNNHVIAAATAMFATYAAMRIWYDGKRQGYWFALAGFFAALTYALEVPAAAFAGLLFLLLLIKAPMRTLTWGLLFALIPLIADVYTNYLVVGSWKEAFIPMPLRFDDKPGPYFYDGSYWHPNKYNPGGASGMDALDEPKGIYLAHTLIGHHGVFLLTPVFLISLLGIFAHWLRRDERARPMLAAFVLVLSAVVIGAMARNTVNYGGGCQGFRRLFWLIPLWLMMLPAGVELLARARLGRLVCVLFMGVSLLSVYWALPQVDDHQKVEDRHTGVQRPFSMSWAHELFRDFPWEPLRITY